MSRLQLSFQERRFTDRRKPTGLMPGKLLVAGKERVLNCRPVDVSRNGLGVIMSDQIEPGTELILTYRNKEVHLQIAWSQQDFAKQDQFRYGLVTLDPRDDLEGVFIECGCLK